MDSRSTINITFNNAKQQAGRLNDCADKLKTIQNQIDTLCSNLQREWSGEAADAFLAKCGAMKDKIKGTAADLRQISGVISSAANAYYAAEMKALEIAATRE